MNLFQQAVDSSSSTILYGSLGRYPNCVKFYLEALPELEYASEHELVFWYKKRRLLYVFFEPPFDTILPSNLWFLVLTSHPRLRYDPFSTRFVNYNFPLQKEIPMPQKQLPHHIIVVPPTSHPMKYFNMKPLHIDLSNIENSHECYLKLLIWYDVVLPSTEWSFSISEKLRQVLLKDIPETGPYDTHLRKMLFTNDGSLG